MVDPSSHFRGRGAEYRAGRPTYPRELAAWLAREAGGRRLAWEPGCGSGQLTGVLCDAFDAIIATDVSEDQLRHAPTLPRTTWLCAAAEAAPLPESVADLVVAAQAAHWFRMDAFQSEARRVARREALVALVTYGEISIAAEVDAVLRHVYRHVVGTYWSPERRHVESSYATLPFTFDRVPAPAFEMRVRWGARRVVDYVRSWSATRAFVHAEPEAAEPALAEVERALLAAWGDPSREREVRWPVTVVAGRA